VAFLPTTIGYDSYHFVNHLFPMWSLTSQHRLFSTTSGTMNVIFDTEKLCFLLGIGKDLGGGGIKHDLVIMFINNKSDTFAHCSCVWKPSYYAWSVSRWQFKWSLLLLYSFVDLFRWLHPLHNLQWLKWLRWRIYGYLHMLNHVNSTELNLWGISHRWILCV
jgi:hypothetical protein